MSSRAHAAQPQPEFKVPNLERGLRILEYLVECQSSVTVNGLAKELGIPANSAGRIMNALDHYGYVDRDQATKRYRISRKMWSMGYGGPDCRSLLEDSLDVMCELRDEVSETVVISIFDRKEGLVLEQVPGIHSFRFVVDPGTRQLPHSSASTKAILAFMPSDKLATVLDSIEYPKMTATTITSKDQFIAELETVRSVGYALDRAEAIDGVHCVAAPIRNYQGYAEAAITVTGPSQRMPLNRLEATGNRVKECTDVISQRRGFIR